MSSQRRPLKWAKVFVRKRLSGKCFWSPSIFMSNRHRPIFPRVFMMVTDNYLNQNIFFCHISSLLSLLASERFQMSLNKSLQKIYIWKILKKKYWQGHILYQRKVNFSWHRFAEIFLWRKSVQLERVWPSGWLWIQNLFQALMPTLHSIKFALKSTTFLRGVIS